MAVGNALNITAAGLVKFSGTAFSGVTLTQHDVLVGASSNGITSVSPSTSGFVLTSNGVSADPSFQAIPGSFSNSFVTDAGTAVPSSGVLDILGSHGINTSGATNVVTVAIDNSISLGDLTPIAGGSDAIALTTGDISLSSGNVKMTLATSADTGIIKFDSLNSIYTNDSTNWFCGLGAGNLTLTGDSNTCIGTASGQNITTASSGVFIGLNSGIQIQDGGSCTFVGTGAGAASVSGSLNVGLGTGALASVGNGSGNTALGTYAGGATGAGNFNVFIGYNSGSNYTSSETSNILIANNGVVGESGHIRIGNGQNQCYVAGIASVAVSNLNFVTIDTVSGQLGSIAAPTGFTWNEVATDTAAAASNGYFVTAAANITLPAGAALGDTIEVSALNASGVVITANTGDTIQLGNSSSSSAGTLTNTKFGDSIVLVYSTGLGGWVGSGVQGNWTVA